TASKETQVSMSYTAATYEIKTLPGKNYVDLQIKDATLQIGKDTIHTTGHQMDLIFNADNSAPSSWKVKCVSGSTETQIAGGSNNRIKIADNLCNFNPSWSNIMRVFPGDNNNSIQVRTVWDLDATGDGDLKNEFGIEGLGLINVFKFRTHQDTGTIGLAATNTTKIFTKTYNPIGNGFKTEPIKSAYESSLNWTVLHNIGINATFAFQIDVSGKDQLILFDKDADAQTLFNIET